ncbi:tRNA (adenine(37)-N6)-methyltransferase [Uranotaenia lowii]|uniref:tRNA (adenine(37)-N6)-methyltransferase n=1 Tax=Uranotaenia lowii TaxID=190385 RepID=UPI00247A8157|nr:tRNA (adenine(37)-N6)-methyltransferase [Uranotaenia lowii]
MDENCIEVLKNQLSIARNEIKNLRLQIGNLQHVHQKEIQNINQKLESFQCESCRTNQIDSIASNTIINEPSNSKLEFEPIGVIKTVFPEKKAVPRQANMFSQVVSRIELSSAIFNNPEHSLDGLEKFSHVWIIYHFHRNQAHLKAKVAPPRLGGERVGVFSTRSPHRPCPIGLSLVQLDRIEGSSIYFFGTDMVNDTPVLDIKPYIPQYDVPEKFDEQQFHWSREAPDGEENFENTASVRPVPSNAISSVAVPNWVLNSSTLRVLFNENAENQIKELAIDKKSIADILKADPRSVYLRTKYGSQIFTFQLSNNTVTCKFDDQQSTVTVLQVRKVINLCDLASGSQDEL